MNHYSSQGIPRNRFQDSSKAYFPETQKDLQGKQSPGFIYESHVFKTIAPPNMNKVKSKYNYSFGKSIREASQTNVTIR